MASKIPFVLAVTTLLAASPVPAYAQRSTDETSAENEASTQARMAPGKLLFLPVEYSAEPNGTPLVSDDVDDVDHSSLRISKSLGFEVVPRDLLGSLQTPSDRKLIEDFEQDFETAQKLFFAQGEAAAIPALEEIVRRTDELLPQLSTQSAATERFLRAKLLLWESKMRTGEDAQELDTTMRDTAAMFPTATVNTQTVAPEVAEAYGRARDDLAKDGVPLNLLLEPGSGGCTVHLNGLPVPLGTTTIQVRPGSTYYVAALCEAGTLTLPAMTAGRTATDVHVNPSLLTRIARTEAGFTLIVPEGPDAVELMEDLTTIIATTFGVDIVILFGRFRSEDPTTQLQFDHFPVGAARTCSTRAQSDRENPATNRAQDIELSLRAIVEIRRPRQRILFAGEDGRYATGREFAENSPKGDSQRPWTWVTGALAATALGTAFLLDHMASNTRDDILTCGNTDTCVGRQRDIELRERLDQDLYARNVVYVTSGAFAVTALVLYFVEASAPVQNDVDFLTEHPTFRPWILPGAAGADLAIEW